MLKKTVTYTDFNGIEQTEDLYFNLNNIELMKIKDKIPYWEDNLKFETITQQDVDKLIDAFEILILASYGVKSEDGKRFIKNDKIRSDFEQSAVFDAVINEFLEDPSVFTSFMTGILPKKIADKIVDK